MKNKADQTEFAEDEMVYGRNPVLETLRSDRDVNKLFVQDGLTDNKINKVLTEAKKRKVQLSFVPKNKTRQTYLMEATTKGLF